MSLDIAQRARSASVPSPVIELRGGGFQNKGAELMLRTAAGELRRRFPAGRIGLKYTIGTPAQRRQIGADDIVWCEAHRIPPIRMAHNFLASYYAGRRPVPEKDIQPLAWSRSRPMRVMASVLRSRAARQRSALIPSDVDLVLDLSGFAYGDPWGHGRASRAARYFARIRSSGGSVILLPQQLGPFEDPSVREAFRAMSAQADLIYARDRLSFEAARRVVMDPKTLRQAPDFTTGAAATPPPSLRGRACIVPNTKMMTQTDAAMATAYPEFLRRCVSLLRAKGARPFVLVHDTTGDDLGLTERLRQEDPGLDVVVEQDPFALKGIIGGALITIGSRFHGLVSALSQAVPSLATSWSHKYEMLFEEYGCPECVVEVTISDADLDRAIDHLLVDPFRSRLIHSLRRAEGQRARAVEMIWSEVTAAVLRAWDRRHTSWSRSST